MNLENTSAVDSTALAHDTDHSSAQDNTQGKTPFMRLRDLAVNYGPVCALSDINLDIYQGSIHAIIGENGAGKSTLLKTLAGTQQASLGTIEINGKSFGNFSAERAQSIGISCVFQEMSLIPDLTVAENILLRDPPRRFGIVNRSKQRGIVQALLHKVGAEDLDPETLVKDLPLSRRQLVEIAKGLAIRPKLLILDESTSALTKRDTQHILRLVKTLRDEGMAILYVSHRMGEIRDLADECTVFRSGRKIKTFSADQHTDNDIVEMMLGRSIDTSFPPLSKIESGAKTIVELQDISWDSVLTSITATVRKGEVVGIGGLDGQGQHELLLAIFGALKGVEGDLRLAGKSNVDSLPSIRIRQSPAMAYVPEDRGTHGLVQQMSVGDNILLASTESYLGDFFRPNGRQEKKLADAIERLNIKVNSPSQPVFSLSGGNQQKIVLAKWLSESPDILLLDDPTRGIDVGTKQEIFALIQELASAGCSILMYSSDYQELCHCCHKVLVFYEGRISHTLESEMLTETNLMNAAFNLPLQQA